MNLQLKENLNKNQRRRKEATGFKKAAPYVKILQGSVYWLILRGFKLQVSRANLSYQGIEKNENIYGQMIIRIQTSHIYLNQAKFLKIALIECKSVGGCYFSWCYLYFISKFMASRPNNELTCKFLKKLQKYFECLLNFIF